MNITEAKQQVKDTVEAYLQTNKSGMPLIPPVRQRPLFLLGAPGIGKTAIMEQVAQELGIGLVAYSMTHHTRQSMLGLPAIVHHDFEGFEYESSEYTMSEIIASIYDYIERTGTREGILFLDEVNCVSETLYPSMLQFLQFKTFGRHSIPAGWIVVCAGNPPEYNKSVHEFDIVTLDRLRKIDVEPDYDAWKAYAQETGAHPAITTFLEIKNDCFYSVESTPEGKSFVTARSWSDLSDVMTLFEMMDKPVDAKLIGQFIQSADIASRFAAYYDLFNKYRSDYQVDAIMGGTADESVLERAKAAQFDERIALLGLVLDALTQEMGAIMLQERALVKVRDALREVKPQVISGASLPELLGAYVQQWQAKVASQAKLQTMSTGDVNVLTEAAELATDIIRSCQRHNNETGASAFDEASRNFSEAVGRLNDDATDAEAKLSHSFDFLEEAFGSDREMLVFTVELSARSATSQFINRFGSPSYYAHNEGLLLENHQHDLMDRIDGLGLKDTNTAGKPQKPAASKAGAGVQVTAKSYDSAPFDASASAPQKDEPQEDEGEPEKGEPETHLYDVDKLAPYYAGAQFEYGMPSLCKMILPDNLHGKTALDIGCRRGKGVFRLSDRVGQSGKAIGIDWSSDYIDEATRKMERAWKDTGLSENNMEFHVCYPERLDMAGIEPESIDAIFVNSVSNLFYDRDEAFREMKRVLKPGGIIINETVLADGKRDEEVVSKAIEIGNSVQAAYDKVSFESMLGEIGFSSVNYSHPESVKPTDGALASHPVEEIENDEDVRFTALVATIRK